MTNSELENEQKIKDWARGNPKYRRFMGNPKMLRRLYAKHNKPNKVSDCMPEQEAKLTLFITKLLGKNTVKLCSECGRKPGDKETTECGVSDFVEKEAFSYIAGDETDEIIVTVPPWFEYDSELELEETYVIEGLIREYEGNLQIQPTEKMLQVSEETEDLKTLIKDTVEAHKYKVPEKVFDKVVEAYDSDEVGKALEELGIGLSEGVYGIAD